MNTEEIINNLGKYKSEIVGILESNNWRHFRQYFLIRGKFLSKDMDVQFKSVFCNFYIMNGARGLNDQQKNEFFKILLSGKDDLGEILKKLYEVPGYKNSHKLFLSFGTKLLHTINENLPIYDGNIASVLSLSNQTQPASLEEKIKNRIYIYEELKNDFNILLNNTAIVCYLKNIRRELSADAKKDNFEWKGNLISDTKLLDSLLWALYPINKK